MAEKKANTQEDDAIDAIYESVMSCEPVITKDECDRLADLVFSKDKLIRAWRLAALIGAEGGSFYRDVADDASKAEALAGTVEPLADTAEMLREMASLMDCVRTRISVAGCAHVDFNTWQEASHV